MPETVYQLNLKDSSLPNLTQNNFHHNGEFRPFSVALLAVCQAMRVNSSDLCLCVLGGYELERVNCTACGQQVNHFQRDSVYRHPMLKVLICKVCKWESAVICVMFVYAHES